MDKSCAYIEDVTGVSKQRRDALFNWLATQGESVKIEAVKLQGDLVNQYRSKLYNIKYRQEFFYAMLLLAIIKMHWTETAQQQKKSLSDNDAAMITELRISRLKAAKKTKSSPKKDLIRVRYYEEIAALKSQGLSWREIAEYIRLHHKKSFTFGYLRNCFVELTAEKEGLL